MRTVAADRCRARTRTGGRIDGRHRPGSGDGDPLPIVDAYFLSGITAIRLISTRYFPASFAWTVVRAGGSFGKKGS